jgi:hypothetical protein
MMVATSPPREFREVSQLFRYVREGGEAIMLGVYCPLRYNTERKKKETRDRLNTAIREVLREFGRE